MTVNVEQLPIDVQTSPRVVVWNRETRDGKPTKVPYQATRPADHAAGDDPSTWAPFAVVLETYEDGKSRKLSFLKFYLEASERLHQNAAS